MFLSEQLLCLLLAPLLRIQRLLLLVQRAFQLLQRLLLDFYVFDLLVVLEHGVDLHLELLPFALLLRKLPLELDNFRGELPLFLLVRTAPILRLHELRAKGLLLACKLTLELRLLPLAFLLESLLFFLERCDLILDHFQFLHNFIVLQHLRLHLRRQLGALSLRAFYLLCHLLDPRLRRLELLTARRSLLGALLHTLFQLSLACLVLCR